jgi:hypothetical protein
VPAEPRLEPPAQQLGPGLAAQAPQQGAQHVPRRPAAHRRAAPEQPRDRLGLLGRPAQEFVEQSRLADPRRRGDQQRADLGLVDARRQLRGEHRQLGLASHARRRSAEQRPRRVVVDAEQERVLAGLAEQEAPLEQPRAELVEQDPRASAGRSVDRRRPALEQRRRVLRDLPDRRARPERAASGRQRDPGLRPAIRDDQRRVGRLDRLVERVPAAVQDDHQRAVEQELDRDRERRHRLDQLAAVLLRVAGPAGPRGVEGRAGRGHHHAQQPLVARARRALDDRRALVRRRVVLGRLTEAAQRLDQRLRVGRPHVALLGQHAHQQGLMRRRHRPADRHGLIEHDAREDRHQVLRVERRLAGQALVQHAAQREHVGRRRDVRLAARLLRRHVVRRPDQHPGPRQRRRRLRARHPEVEQPRLLEVAADQEQVARLDVAVHHPVRVRDGERPGDSPQQAERGADGEQAAAQERRQVLALEPLHRQEVHAVVADPVVVVGDDPRVLELREQPRLAHEPLLRVRPGRFVVQQLERDDPPVPARRTPDTPPPCRRSRPDARCGTVRLSRSASRVPVASSAS